MIQFIYCRVHYRLLGTTKVTVLITSETHPLSIIDIMYFVTKVVFKRVSIYVWDAYELFYDKNFFNHIYFLNDKALYNKFTLNIWLKKELLYWNLNYPVIPLHETLHSILCTPLSTFSTTNGMQSTRSMLLYWGVEELQSVECRVQSFV